MVLCTGGGTVSVVVKGQPLPEYKLKEMKKDDEEVYNCYIEAKEGDEYEVRINDFPLIKKHKLRIDVYIDGKWSGGEGRCAPKFKYLCRQQKKPNISLTGYQSSQNSETRVLRAFTFGKLRTTSDSSAKKLSPAEMEKLCKIQVRVIQELRVGEICHEGPIVFEIQPPEASVVCEDTKAALWGLNTEFGKAKVIPSGKSCKCTVVKDPSMTVYWVQFKYLPHARLVAKGLKEELNDSDDDVQIDTNRTKRSADLLARRRAREEELVTPVRNVRVKTEVQVKTEAMVKTETLVKQEEIAKKQVNVFDVTTDGEFVLPSRKVGDTIVIEDD